MKRILLFGAPGSGKGTQSDMIEKQFGYIKISSGDLVREEVKKGSETGIKVKKIIAEGKFVSDSIIIEMIRRKLSENNDKPGYVMDGFPRTLAQARSLSEIDVEKEIAIFLKVDDEELTNRLISRLYCTKCNATYNLITNPPKVAGICDRCGNTLSKRDDDSLKTVKRRMNLFKDETMPAVNFYRNKTGLIEIDATRSIDDISREIVGVLS